MKSYKLKLRTGHGRAANLGRNLLLALGIGIAGVAWGKPAIQSITVSPSPLVTGLPFSISVAASSNVTFAEATIAFHPSGTDELHVPLTRQGLVWTGTGVIPSSLRLLSNKDEAKVKVLALDESLKKDESSLKVDVVEPSIGAVFTNGVLTVTGDNQDNTLVASRDISGNILINGGAVPITGGVATVSNTSLIVMLGLKGNDILTVDDGSGPMPPANLQGGEGDDVLTGSASDDVLDGGPGNDKLFGRGGNDILYGGPGNDILVGGTGADQLFGGEGDDQFIWNPGDGSDVIEGEGGQDTLVFNGSNIGEQVDISANGSRVRFFRNVANITMDCNGIEALSFHALGGSDQVVVNDLTGTGLTNVLIDLSANTGAGDASADTVIVNGTQTNDHIIVSGSITNIDVRGLSATVSIVGAEPDNDRLIIQALDGDDVVDASGVLAGAIALTLDGGAGNDLLIGGQGNDLLIGGRGDDQLFGGAGDDTFLWNPGDGNDVIEGEGGSDTLMFNGANVGENVDISANGARVRLFRNVAAITMDCHGVETIQFNARGEADTITVNDLTGTDVTRINLDLAGVSGTGVGDGQPDRVIINATSGNDSVTVSGSAAGVTVAGLAATVTITGTDPTLDQLLINLLDGDDAFEASNLQAGVILLTVDGGKGNDVIVGSAGDDVLIGGEGDDVLIGGPGQDLLDGGPGNNILIQ